MGEIYKIIAPPDPSIARRKWILIIALAALALIVAAIIFGPGLYHAARLASEGPGKGPVLVKRADGKIELQVPPAQVLIGRALTWRRLPTFSDGIDGLHYSGDFDGDGDQELLWWTSASPVQIWNVDGSAEDTGLKGNKLPLAKVLDWDGDGRDELLVSADDADELLIHPPKELRSRSSDYGSSILSIYGQIIGFSTYFLSHYGRIAGSFTAADKSQAAGSPYESLLDQNSFSAENFKSVQQQPTTVIYGAKDAPSGNIELCPELAAELLAADLDGDGLDELLTLDSAGALWDCSANNKPQRLAEWPAFTAPTSRGNLDDHPGDEVIVVRPHPERQGNLVTLYCSGPKGKSLADENKRCQERILSVVKQRLTAVGAMVMEERESSSAVAATPAEMDQWSTALDRYLEQFVFPPNLHPFGNHALIAWESFRPEGFICFPKEHRLEQLRFPGFLLWSNTWTSMFVGAENAVLCTSPGTRNAVLYVTPTDGTSLLGFNAQGECIYYEEFGKGVSCCGVLHTKDGDYLVLRVGNDLMIYP